MAVVSDQQFWLDRLASVLESWFGSAQCDAESGWAKWAWCEFAANHQSFGALLTFVVGLATLLVGWRVARAALDQAETARERHQKQTEADIKQHEADTQSRITDSFTKAVEQLGDDKSQVVRIGGIYGLGRIARESESDYWRIMHILTAFVRGRAPWRDKTTAPAQMDKASQPSDPCPEPALDVAAALAVIGRRELHDWERAAILIELRESHDRTRRRKLDLRLTDLRGAMLNGAHLELAGLVEAHLEGAMLNGAHLEGAWLNGAHMEEAYLSKADLRKANLKDVHLKGANLEGATGLQQEQLDQAYGNAETRLPKGLTRPAHWGVTPGPEAG